MRQLLWLFVALFFVSCSTTKKQLNKSFDRQFFYDKDYFKIVLPLYTTDEFWHDTLLSLTQRGYVSLIGYKGARSPGNPVYEITDIAKPYLSGYVRDKSRDTSELFAEFNYYRLKKIKLKGYRFLNNERDSVETFFESEYEVNPMFTVIANPLRTRIVFVRSAGDWQMKDSVRAISKIYRIDNYVWWKGLAFKQSPAYREWWSQRIK